MKNKDLAFLLNFLIALVGNHGSDDDSFFFLSGCVGSSLLCAGFLQLQRAGATLRCGAWWLLVAERGL